MDRGGKPHYAHPGHHDPTRRRRFRGQYVRSRNFQSYGGYRAGSFSDDRNDSSPPPSARHAVPSDEPHHQYPANYPRDNQPPVQQHLQHYQQAPSPPEHPQSHHSQNHPPRVRRPQHQFRGYAPRNRSRGRYKSSYGDTDNDEDQMPTSRQTDMGSNMLDQNQQSHHQAEDAPSTSALVNLSKGQGDLTRSLDSQRGDIDDLKTLFSKLCNELDQVRTRLKDLEDMNSKAASKNSATAEIASTNADVKQSDLDPEKERRRKKISKQREKKAVKAAEKRAALLANRQDSNQQGGPSKILTNADRSSDANAAQPTLPANQGTQSNASETGTTTVHHPMGKYEKRPLREKPRVRREPREKPRRPLPDKSRLFTVNDDSTTQAAEPSSEDKPDGDDGHEGAHKEKIRVLRRKKQTTGRRAIYGRRRRPDSSGRNSNDTSPQGDGNDDDDSSYRSKAPPKQFPEYSEVEMNEMVQGLTRQFFQSERDMSAVKKVMNEKGPRLLYEFTVSLLDHAICDVTRPGKLSEISKKLFQLLTCDDNSSEVNFQKGFYEALSDISKREDDIAIDAPRYLDILAQILGECSSLMMSKHKHVLKTFLIRCLESYNQKNRPNLLVSILKSLLSIEDERTVKKLWDHANLSWEKVLEDGTDVAEFVKSHEVEFTTKTYAHEPEKARTTPHQLENFADEVTDMVEKHTDFKALDQLVEDLNLTEVERVDYTGFLIYAIVRGCLSSTDGDYTLNAASLSKYSKILTRKHEQHDAVALKALTALTKLWHEYSHPQDIFRSILATLHQYGTASYPALQSWLNDESLNHIPGIGVARLNCKRYIDDLGANLKS